MSEPADLDYLVMRERHSRELSALPGDAAVKRAYLKIADGDVARIALFAAKP